MSGSKANAAWAVPVACGGAAFLLYALTAARLPQFGDGLEYVAAAASGGVAHPPGYPLFTTLLAPFAFGEGAYFHSTLLCALFGAGTVAGVAVLCRQLLQRAEGETASPVERWLPLFFGLSAAVFCPLWAASTIVEVYGLNALLMVWTMVLLGVGDLRPCSAWRLPAAGLLLGLCLGNHYTGLSLLPLAAFRLVQIARRDGARTAMTPTLATAGAFVLGACVLLLLPLRASTDPPINWGGADTMQGFLWMLGGGDYGSTQFLQAEPGTQFTLAAWLQFAVGRIQLLIAWLGAGLIGGLETAVAWRRLVAVVLGLGLAALAVTGARGFFLRDAGAVVALAIALAGHLLIYLTYNIQDISDYFLSFAVLLSPFLALGLLRLIKGIARVGGYDSEPGRLWRLGAFGGLVILTCIGANWKAADRSSRDTPAAWLERLEEALPENSMVLTHGDYATYMLWYLKHAEGRRDDITIVAANFMRNDWYERMAPPAQPDALGRSVVVEPGDYRQFTAQDHAGMIARNVIDPNLGTGPLLTLAPDPVIGQLLQQRYDLQPRAALLSEEEAMEILTHQPILPPPALFAIESRGTSTP